MEKALNVSDLSQSDKEKSGKRQRFVTQRYTPPLDQVSRYKNNTNVDDLDSDFESTAPAVRNLKIRGWFFFIIYSHFISIYLNFIRCIIIIHL